MIIQKLHSANGVEWKLKKLGDKKNIAAAVPGSVYSALLDAGEIEDPYWRDNEMAALSLMEDDWVFEASVTPSAELLDCQRVLLRCKGLDTLADLYLNGVLLGTADNMHRTWEFDVKELLLTARQTEKCNLRLLFHSPLRYFRQEQARQKADGSSDAIDGFPHLRKAHCMSGWDWGPRLPDAGIWRDIELVGVNTARLDSVCISQNHRIKKTDASKNKVDLSFCIKIDTEEKFSSRMYHGKRIQNYTWEKSPARIAYQVTITAPNGKVTVYEKSPKKIAIDNPELWWPNGLGAQPLYTIKVELVLFAKKSDAIAGKREVLDVWERRIGLRTLTMHIENDVPPKRPKLDSTAPDPREFPSGTSFAHEVNGQTFFAMGADYIPEDNMLSRVTPERTRKLLEQCKAAHFNVIRVWGGGYYPDDFFYDACDELGLVVWQDCMFACAVYNLDPQFDANIRAELRDNVRRLRHHASLGLWCGNNEMEQFVDEGEWVDTPRQKADYIKMYEYIIPEIIREEDPATFYWPASPSSGGSFDNPRDPKRGDVHYWEVWHGNLPFSDYRRHYFRYLSEFGFQSFPALKTIESFTLPEDRNIFSWVMEKHQRNNAANGKIMSYLAQTYLYPADLDTLVYASQLLQAEAIKYGVEHFRRNRGYCMGAVYWQLNDIWPVASWASIDYFGRWKALHYYAKRFFQPLTISCKEEGVLTQDTNANSQKYFAKPGGLVTPFEKSIKLCIENETEKKISSHVLWELRENTGKILRSEKETANVAAWSSQWLEKVILPADIDINTQYVSYHLCDEKNKTLAEGTVIFSLPKWFHWIDPELSCTVEGDTITVKAKAYAKSVEIRNANEDLILSDNYFDMNAGEKKVKILAGKADKLRLRSVYNIK